MFVFFSEKKKNEFGYFTSGMYGYYCTVQMKKLTFTIKIIFTCVSIILFLTKVGKGLYGTVQKDAKKLENQLTMIEVLKSRIILYCSIVCRINQA